MAEDILKYLEKVLQSSEFQNSPKYQKLLEYLVHSTLEGKVPKEITIAMELFGAEMSDDTLGESNIRVYIHNVRKKLDSYYNNEGKSDRIEFRIPKGRYKVEFLKRKENARPLLRNPIFMMLAVLAVLVLADLLIIRGRLARETPLVRSPAQSGIWGDFLSRDVPLLVVVGDYYLIKETTYPDRSRYLRDVRINSGEDLDRFLAEHPEYSETYTRTKHTFMGKYAPLCIEKLGKLLVREKKEFDVILASEFQWQNLKNSNVIYIGSFKSLGMLGNLIKNSNFRFNLFPSELHFHSLEADSTYSYYPFDSDMMDAFETDYCVVTKLRGSGENNVLMFLSVRDIGLIETLEYFTDPESQKMFRRHMEQKRMGTDYFEACFKIEGLDRNSISIDLLHVNPLSGSIPAETEGT